MTCTEARKWLGALLDGQLDPANSAAVSSHLKECPDCQAERRALEALQFAVSNVRQEVAPDRLRMAIDKRLPGPPRPKRGLDWTVGFAAGLAAAAVAWIWFTRAATPNALVAEIVSSHVRSLSADHLLDVVSSDRHTVKPWFSGKVDVSPTPWDLKNDGFPLLGGRLDWIAHRPTPVLVYGHNKHDLNVFVFNTDQVRGAWRDDRQGFRLVAWQQDGLEYVAVSDMDPAEIDRFEQVYRSQK